MHINLCAGGVIVAPYSDRFTSPSSVIGHRGIYDYVYYVMTNFTAFHGVFAPNSNHRIQVTPARRGKVKKKYSLDEDPTPAERRAAMTWAQRLKRVFDIDIETCSECGGDVRIIACIEDPAVISKILTYLDDKVATVGTARLPQCRAPPATGLFD